MLRNVRGDISDLPQSFDVIINSAHPSLRPGGGVSGALHAKAGKHMAEECRIIRDQIGRDLRPPDNALTGGNALRCAWVLHAVAPDISSIRSWEEAPTGLLRATWFCAFDRIQAMGAKSVAVPLIGAGIYGWPEDVALKSLTEVAARFTELDITLVILPSDKLTDIKCNSCGEKMAEDWRGGYLGGAMCVNEKCPAYDGHPGPRPKKP